MKTLSVNGKEYKIKFGYNAFCDTDLMERVKDMANIFKDSSVENDNDISGIGKIKELFIVVRELLYVGFKKYNPVDDIQEIGNILDDYSDEETDEQRGLFQLFSILSDELMNMGFLKEILGNANPEMMDGAKAPQDHKKSEKK